MNENDGLIFAYILNGRGGGQALDWDGVRAWSAEKGIVWLHLDYANGRAQGWLSENSGLSAIMAESLLAEDTRPRCLLSEEGLLLILRGVNCNPGSDPEDMVSLRMLFAKDRIITMRHRRVMAIDEVNSAITSGRGPTSSADFLIFVCRRITDRMADVVADIDESVDALEDAVLTGESYELRPRLSNLRRQTISLRRYMAPQRDVLSRLQHERVSWLDEMDRAHVREIGERTARFVEDIDSALERAAITQEELNNRLAERMNKAMYLLTIVAAIFLPLGLLTGLLGINVGGIPGAETKWAFGAVALLLVGIAVALIGWFRHIKWL
jgi:zinc transporter